MAGYKPDASTESNAGSCASFAWIAISLEPRRLCAREWRERERRLDQSLLFLPVPYHCSGLTRLGTSLAVLANQRFARIRLNRSISGPNWSDWVDRSTDQKGGGRRGAALSLYRRASAMVLTSDTSHTFPYVACPSSAGLVTSEQTTHASASLQKKSRSLALKCTS